MLCIYNSIPQPQNICELRTGAAQVLLRYKNISTANLELGGAAQALLPQLHHLNGILNIHGHVARAAEWERERHSCGFLALLLCKKETR